MEIMEWRILQGGALLHVAASVEKAERDSGDEQTIAGGRLIESH
jgi:hypothetical protein